MSAATHGSDKAIDAMRQIAALLNEESRRLEFIHALATPDEDGDAWSISMDQADVKALAENIAKAGSFLEWLAKTAAEGKPKPKRKMT